MKGSMGLKKPPFKPGERGEMGRDGRQYWGKNMGFGLFSPPKDKRIRKETMKPRKTQHGHLRRGENQCKYQYKNRKRKRTHIVIREQLKSLLVFPK